MFKTVERLVLASASPRRQQYLRDLGLDFEISAAEIDEKPGTREAPDKYVLRMAEEKALAVMVNFQESWVLAADTIVFIEKDILGKPASEEEAVRFLMRLSDKKHRVATSFCLTCLQKQVLYSETVKTDVWFAPFTEKQAAAYVRTGEPMDKAGAYGIQGKGAFLVKKIQGSYSNVVGLPLSELVAVMNKYGIVKTK